MKKVMVFAYTTLNLGDDLFIKILCERYPHIKFVLYAPKIYKKLFKEISNLTIFPSDSLLVRGLNLIGNLFKSDLIIRKLIAKNCDAGVYIGGSLFIQGEQWRESLNRVKQMKIKNKPYYLLGANFGPFKENKFFNEYNEIFKEYTDICFREKYSYDLFKNLSNVRLADDIVFQLDVKKSKYMNNNIVISVIKPSIRKHLSNYDDIYYKKIKEVSIYFIDKGYNVTFMSFCEFEGDSEAIEAIINIMPINYKSKITKFLYKTNIEEALTIIEKSSLVIASRFHSMILGWVFQKPVFPIVYSNKMINVMNDIDYNGLYTDFKNIYKLEPKDVYQSMETNLIDISTQVKNSENHFEKLDQLLN